MVIREIRSCFRKTRFFKDMESLANGVSTLSSHKGTCLQDEVPIHGHPQTAQYAWHEALRGGLEGPQGTSKGDKPDWFSMWSH